MNKLNAKRSTLNAGFTLIEILVVIGMIALLATIVLIAINPARQFKQGRDTQRNSNVNTILNAIGQKIADGKGTFAGLVPGSNPAQTCPNLSTTGPNPLTAGIDYSIFKDNDSGVSGTTIHMACISPTYVASYPTDPTGASGDDTGYDVSIDANGRITVKAPATELGDVISITR